MNNRKPQLVYITDFNNKALNFTCNFYFKGTFVFFCARFVAGTNCFDA